MNRDQALQVARAKYKALVDARINHEFKNGSVVNEADFDYKHGWVTVGEFAFGTMEMVGPSNQPYMD